MTKTEGAKPQIAVLPKVDALEQSYSEFLADMLSDLNKTKARGDKIDLHTYVGFLDPKQNNDAIADWMILAGITTRSGFRKAMARAERQSQIQSELGFIPCDCPDFVEQYVEKQNISLSANDQIIRHRGVKYGETIIEARDVAKDDCSPIVRLAYRLGNSSAENLDDFRLELRLIRDRLKLDYNDTMIADAVRAWAKVAHADAKLRMFMDIAYTRGRATGDDGQAMWAKMEAACFDITDTKPGFAIDIIRKFMWQVKRKAAGLPVTSHLMPVLTGPQGKGKSTFVEQLCAPLADTLKPVDFGMITDNRIIDIWAAHILFIDEMSNFTRSDVEEVKRVITQSTLTRRPMRSNDTVQVKQEATLIGCSNRSLGQLIRDDTGGRRFAELVWRTDPDWKAMNEIDWTMLWTSVDENAPDPIVGDIATMLRDQQEANRNQTPVEIWAIATKGFATWTSSSDLHAAYREWEKEAFPRHDTNLTMFGRTLTNLIQTIPDFPWEKTSGRAGVAYRKVG